MCTRSLHAFFVATYGLTGLSTFSSLAWRNRWNCSHCRCCLSWQRQNSQSWTWQLVPWAELFRQCLIGCRWRDHWWTDNHPRVRPCSKPIKKARSWIWVSCVACHRCYLGRWWVGLPLDKAPADDSGWTTSLSRCCSRSTRRQSPSLPCASRASTTDKPTMTALLVTSSVLCPPWGATRRFSYLEEAASKEKEQMDIVSEASSLNRENEWSKDDIDATKLGISPFRRVFQAPSFWYCMLLIVSIGNAWFRIALGSWYAMRW